MPARQRRLATIHAALSRPSANAPGNLQSFDHIWAELTHEEGSLAAGGPRVDLQQRTRSSGRRAAPTAPQPVSQSGAAPPTGAFEGTALVTGAAGGIGRAVVHLLLSRGATVIAVDRPEGVLSRPDEAGVDSLPPDPKLVPVAVDLADEDATRNTLR